MYRMFSGCSSLSSLPDISKWNTKYTVYLNIILDGSLNIIISKKIKRKFKFI